MDTGPPACGDRTASAPEDTGSGAMRLPPRAAGASRQKEARKPLPVPVASTWERRPGRPGPGAAGFEKG